MIKDSLKTVSGEVIEALTLAQLARSCDVQSSWIVELVEEGILEPRGGDPSVWRFSAVSMTRVLTARRLQRDLGVNRQGIALVLDLLEERQQLRLHLKRLQRSLATEDRDRDAGL